jgi:hypothetical protein
MNRQYVPLTLDEWHLVATQTTICRSELQSLYAMVHGRVPAKELYALSRINRTLSLLRYRLEAEMYQQTSTKDTGIFEQERVPR